MFSFTPTGMIPTRAETPHVPVMPEEIIEETIQAAALGITIVHLHARDPETGVPSPDPDVYAAIIQGIRSTCPDLIITVSTSGRCTPAFKTRAAVLDLDEAVKPDMASLTLSSLNFNQRAAINTPKMIMSLARRMQERGIKPELEVFDTGMINYARYLERKGLITPPFYFNIILGNIACAQADPLHLGILIRDLPPASVWAVGGVGRAQLSANLMGLVAGGGVRLGLEDNIWYDDARTQKATNIALLERLLELAGMLELTPYSGAEGRKVLRLEARS